MKKIITVALVLLTVLFCGCMDFEMLFHTGNESDSSAQSASSVRSADESAVSPETASEEPQSEELSAETSSVPWEPESEPDPVGCWVLIDTEEYLNESTEYDDGAGLFYQSTGNSVSYTYRDNNLRDFSGTCYWTEPSSVISDGVITVTLTAEIDEFNPDRAGSFTASINAYLDSADLTSQKYKTGAAIDLTAADGTKTCKAYGKDGGIVVGSASLEVSASFPAGSEGQTLCLMISTNIGGGKKYIYQYQYAG